MKFQRLIGLLAIAVLLISCNSNPSLQQYYVDNQGNKDFIAIDVPTSLFANSDNLDEEQKRILATVKKINVLAIPGGDKNRAKIEVERENIANILKDEKYQLLMKMGSGDSKVEVYFTGEEEAVDEVIVYGHNEQQGMGIARVLGNDMNPGEIYSLMSSLNKGDINTQGLSGITQLFAAGTPE